MKEILNLIKTKWHEYLLEIIVIILGILLAFALNNWNEQRIQKHEEQKILKVLLREFEGNIEELDRIILSHHGNIDRLNETLKFLEKQDTSSGSGDLILSIRNAIYGNTYNPRFGVMNSLLNSDRINLIRNENLKYSLARFPGLIDDYTEEEEIILRVIFDIIMPELMKLNPQSKKIDNILINNTMFQLIMNIEYTITEGKELDAEMNRILDLIKDQIR